MSKDPYTRSQVSLPSENGGEEEGGRSRGRWEESRARLIVDLLFVRQFFLVNHGPTHAFWAAFGRSACLTEDVVSVREKKKAVGEGGGERRWSEGEMRGRSREGRRF